MTERADMNAPTWMRLKHLSTIMSSNVDKIVDADEEAVRLCNYVDVYYNDLISGNLSFETGSAKQVEIEKFRLRAGDVIITKDSESPDDIAIPALVDQSADGVVCGYHLAILRPTKSKIYPPYLFWSLKAKSTREAFGIAAQGVTRFGLTLNAIGSISIPVPSLERQQAIACGIDRETARIDKLIALKERQIGLLRKRADIEVINIVVGQRGSHGSGGEPTGLRHVPLLPAGWSLRRAGLLFQQVNERGDDSLPVLSVSIHTGISNKQLDDLDRDRKVNFIEDRTKYKRVRPGYLAYNMMRAWQGAIGVSTVDGAVSPAYVVAKPRSDLHSPYYQFLLRTPSFVEEMRRGSKGITDFRLRLYWEQFRQILLPVPPLHDQKRIAQEASEVLARTSALTARMLDSVARLKLRRDAIITAAIAGGIGA